MGAQVYYPARDAAAVTPHNTNDLDEVTVSLYVGTAGDVKVNMAQTGDAITFPNVQDGSILPVQVTRVYDTGTTASDIVALYR